MNNPVFIASAVVLIVLLILLAIVFNFFALWARALFSGAPIDLLTLIGMRLRRVNARQVINSRIQLCRAGVDVAVPQLETHVLAGGDLPHVTTAVIAAKMGGKELAWNTATAMDLAGRDAVEYVKSGAFERGQDWKQAPRRRPARDFDRVG